VQPCNRATVQPRKFKPAEDEQEDIDPDGSTMSLETLLNIHNTLSVKAPILVPVVSTTAGAAREPKVTTRVEALWRTLVADCCEGVYPVPVECGFGFADWICSKVTRDLPCRKSWI